MKGFIKVFLVVLFLLITCIGVIYVRVLEMNKMNVNEQVLYTDSIINSSK